MNPKHLIQWTRGLSLVTGFNDLEYAEKSQVITSWLQAIVIVIGIPVAISQLSTSQQSLEDQRMREATRYAKEHDLSQADNRNLLAKFFEDASELKKDQLSTDVVTAFDAKWNVEQVKDTFDEYMASVFELINCTESRICNESHIENSLCWEIVNLLYLAGKIEVLPDSWIRMWPSKVRLEEPFFITCPSSKSFGYMLTGDL